MKILIGDDPKWCSLFSSYKFKPHHVIVSKINNMIDILECCKLLKISHILPVSISDILFVLKNKETLKIKGITCCLSDINIISKLHNKKIFGEYMEQNFPDYIPKIYKTSDDLIKIKYPLILKNKSSDFGRDVHIIKYHSELKKFNVDNYVLQEYIPGNNEFVTHVLAYEGTIIKHLTKEHLHSSNIYVRGENYVTISTKTVEIADNIIESIQNVIKELKFSGFCCVDYKIVENKIKIFEINPRIGSSLAYDKEGFQEFFIEYVNMISKLDLN
jgi:carbamoylphosphate synthase large subunit